VYNDSAMANDADTTSFTVRPATPDDVPAIQRVGVEADARYRDVGHPELDDNTMIPSDVALNAIASENLWVAEHAGQILGWAYTGRLGAELCLGQISVAPAFGRRGVGTALLVHVIALARQAGEPTMVLNTQGDVPWCAAWFARHGFQVVYESKWSPSLIKVAAEQTAAGLDWSTRVHMRLYLV
jgi:N-acetylglutamate synthase-like GNAT family acetyltransferase